MLSGKAILITGGTGSFGSTVAQRLLKTEVGEIRVFSRDEFKQSQMRALISDQRVSFRIGDVRDISSVRTAMSGIDYVFHGAAMKVVPTCEDFPLQAVMTNVLGSENVFQAAVDLAVSRVVSLSTDKACQPVNAMGMSKALLEKLSIAKARQNTHTTFVSTRFGNVLSSRGSVIPYFIDQILSGRPITVTDPNMTRFMLTLDEAVSLVVHAFEFGTQGDLFVRKAPAATVLTIATSLNQIFNTNNEIETIGARRGEKVHETLVTSDEMSRSKDCGEYYRVPMDSSGASCTRTEYTSHNTYRMTQSETVTLLRQLQCVKDALEDKKES